MKDYKLSEVKAICIKNNHVCSNCEISIYIEQKQRYFCQLCDRDPKFWDIEESRRCKITDTGKVFSSYNDWVKENAKEHYPKFQKDRERLGLAGRLFYTELKEGDIVEILASAPYGMNTFVHKADYKLYLVKKENGWLEVIGEAGIEILE